MPLFAFPYYMSTEEGEVYQVTFLVPILIQYSDLKFSFKKKVNIAKQQLTKCYSVLFKVLCHIYHFEGRIVKLLTDLFHFNKIIENRN